MCSFVDFTATQSCVLLQNIQAIKDGRVPIERVRMFFIHY